MKCIDNTKPNSIVFFINKNQYTPIKIHAMNTLLTDEMKAILLVLCSQQANAKQSAQAEVEKKSHYSYFEEKESFLKELRAVNDQEFDVLLPLLKAPIDERLLPKDKIRILKYNQIHFVWHLLVQDWPYFPEKKLDVNGVLHHITQAIDPEFKLNFVLCFSSEQKKHLN